MLPLCIQRALLHSDLPSFRTCTCTYTDVCHAIMIRCTSQTCVIPIPYHAVHFIDVCHTHTIPCGAPSQTCVIPIPYHAVHLHRLVPYPYHTMRCTSSQTCVIPIPYHAVHFTDVCHTHTIPCGAPSQTCVIPIPYHAVHFTDVCHTHTIPCGAPLHRLVSYPYHTMRCTSQTCAMPCSGNAIAIATWRHCHVITMVQVTFC